MSHKEDSRLNRKARIRKKVSGTPARPRMTIYKSLKHIYAQVIDDAKGHTVAAASSMEKDLRSTLKTGADKAAATAVGKLLAERARKAGIDKVVFDRGGYRYHGRIKALADGAREGGLNL